MSTGPGCFDFPIQDHTFESSQKFIEDVVAARNYLSKRKIDAEKLISEIKQKNGLLGCINLALPIKQTDEEILGFTEKGEVYLFKNSECATAFILAKYW